MTAVVSDTSERAALQQRVLRVLALGQVVGGAALASAVTVGAFVVQDILGHDTPWAGTATAVTTTGTAFMSQVLARKMSRHGRRPGLQLGYGLAAVGGGIAAVGVETGSLIVFIVGLFLFGNGQAANLLARYAATDLAEPDERSRAMSRIVFASTFGAVLGPILIGPTEDAGQRWFDLDKYTGPWLLGAALFTLAMANTALRLRPDPLVASGTTDLKPAAHPRIADAARAIATSPGARLALTAMVISQMTMVAVMAMTPVHLKLHGHEEVSQYLVSLHIAGMYAFSPLVGRFADRRGRLPAILLGSSVLTASTVLAALSGDVEQLLFPSLWALGLGWNFGLIGGSSLLIDSVPATERIGVQGTADLLMSLCGGVAGFASGFVRRSFGYHLLAAAALHTRGVPLNGPQEADGRTGHQGRSRRRGRPHHRSHLRAGARRPRRRLGLARQRDRPVGVPSPAAARPQRRRGVAVSPRRTTPPHDITRSHRVTMGEPFHLLALLASGAPHGTTPTRARRTDHATTTSGHHR